MAEKNPAVEQDFIPYVSGIKFTSHDCCYCKWISNNKSEVEYSLPTEMQKELHENSCCDQIVSIITNDNTISDIEENKRINRVIYHLPLQNNTADVKSSFLTRQNGKKATKKK